MSFFDVARGQRAEFDRHLRLLLTMFNKERRVHPLLELLRVDGGKRLIGDVVVFDAMQSKQTFILPQLAEGNNIPGVLMIEQAVCMYRALGMFSLYRRTNTRF